jgi:molecular chaperone GrpE
MKQPEQEGPKLVEAEQASQDAPGSGTPSAEEPISEEELTSPEVELQAAQGELEVLEDRYLRVRAEYENYRKRTGQELKSSWNRAQADFVSSLMEALDDLQRVGGWEAGATTVEALIEGVDLVEQKFAQALQAAGVEVIQPEIASRFDPNIMEAMLRVDAEDESQDETVAQVFSRGYRLGDNLIRPARVSVFKSD